MEIDCSSGGDSTIEVDIMKVTGLLEGLKEDQTKDLWSR